MQDDRLEGVPVFVEVDRRDVRVEAVTGPCAEKQDRNPLGRDLPKQWPAEPSPRQTAANRTEQRPDDICIEVGRRGLTTVVIVLRQFHAGAEERPCCERHQDLLRRAPSSPTSGKDRKKAERGIKRYVSNKIAATRRLHPAVEERARCRAETRGRLTKHEGVERTVDYDGDHYRRCDREVSAQQQSSYVRSGAMSSRNYDRSGLVIKNQQWRGPREGHGILTTARLLGDFEPFSLWAPLCGRAAGGTRRQWPTGPSGNRLEARETASSAIASRRRPGSSRERRNPHCRPQRPISRRGRRQRRISRRRRCGRSARFGPDRRGRIPALRRSPSVCRPGSRTGQ